MSCVCSQLSPLEETGKTWAITNQCFFWGTDSLKTDPNSLQMREHLWLLKTSLGLQGRQTAGWRGCVRGQQHSVRLGHCRGADVVLTLKHFRLVSLDHAAGLVVKVEAQLRSAMAAVLPLFLSSSLYTSHFILQPRSLLW